MVNKPDAQSLSTLHQRLLAGDPVAPAEFAEHTVTPLAELLRTLNQGLRDRSMADEAATDAVLDFVKSPQAFDPTRSSVWGFLELAAKRNLANLRLKEQRQRGKISRFHDVALHDPARKKVQDSPLASLVASEANAEDQKRLSAEVADLKPEEAQVFRLMREGVRETAEYARALGIVDRPHGEQRAIVKQIKDRLLKRMKRSLRETGNE